jgi:DNA-binding NtrC family response regulator
MRILVVDDEPAIRFALADLLESEGHEVAQAEHAPAALALADARSFDLVLTDYRMPKVDGLELLEGLLRDHPGLLVAMLTAHGDERTAVRALKLGAYDYVPKPYDNEEIRALVARRASCSRCAPRTRGCARSSRPGTTTSSAARRRCARPTA